MHPTLLLNAEVIIKLLKRAQLANTLTKQALFAL
jgi:hypothetical protein